MSQQETVKQVKLTSEPSEEIKARMRAFIMTCIQKSKVQNVEGLTYPQIRAWIEANCHFLMEGVDRRVRELAGRVREYPQFVDDPWLEIRYDHLHRAHIYLKVEA